MIRQRLACFDTLRARLSSFPGQRVHSPPCTSLPVRQKRIIDMAAAIAVVSSLVDHWSPLESIKALIRHLYYLPDYSRDRADILSVASLALLGGTVLAQNTSQPFLGVVPRPSEYTIGNRIICLSDSLRVRYDGGHFPGHLVRAADTLTMVLNTTTHRYLSVERGAEFFANGLGCQSYIDELVLSVTSGTGGTYPLQSVLNDSSQPVEVRPDLERYSLSLGTGNKAMLTSNSALGLFRGLSTFGQLFYRHEEKLYAPFGPYEIHDRPSFGWRAVLLDTSRHFFPIEVLKRQLDIMTMVKLNVLHWLVGQQCRTVRLTAGTSPIPIRGHYTSMLIPSYLRRHTGPARCTPRPTSES